MGTVRRVFYEDDDATFVEARNLLIGTYRGCPTVDHIRVLRAQLQHHFETYPDGVALMVALHCDGWIPRFDEEFRQEIQELIRVAEPHSLGTAFVLSGHGMVTSGLRAFVNGLFLLTKSREPNRVFRQLAPAAEWLSSLPGMRSRWSSQEILERGLELGVGSGRLLRAG